MPIVALAPLIAAGIGAGGAIASSKIAGSSAKKAQQQAADIAKNDPLAIAQREQINQQTAYGKEQADYSRQLFPKYMEGTNYLSDYWRSVLQPNNSEALKAISPLVQARKGQTQAQLRGLQFAPRGGGMGAQLNDIYSSESRDILNALSGERENARTNYAQLTGDIGARASNLLGGATGSASNAASLLGSMADRSITSQLNAMEAARTRSGETTRGIADALSPLLYSILFKKKNDSSGGGWGGFNPGFPNTGTWGGGDD